MTTSFTVDKLIFSPKDVDLKFSPLRKSINEETYVLGVFNPGVSRLANGNIIMMMRVAEALKHPEENDIVKALRWDESEGFVLDKYNSSDVNLADPRQIQLLKHGVTVIALTSISWLLPVEFSPDGESIVKIYYDKTISSEKSYQEYGVEDPRITKVGSKYYMTTCSVSSQRQSSTLYVSDDGLDFELIGIILDHQNKDMLIFEGKIGRSFYALTRPLGSLYFACPPGSAFNPGPSINIAESPDMLHWKPMEKPLIRPLKSGMSAEKVGGGAQPILTPAGWLVLFHGVEQKGEVGIYRTFWALMDKDDPTKIIHIELNNALLEANSEITKNLKDSIYLEDVVFTTGIVEDKDDFIVISGELDMCVRLTRIPKNYFLTFKI